jgi:hypothetical protein
MDSLVVSTIFEISIEYSSIPIDTRMKGGCDLSILSKYICEFKELLKGLFLLIHLLRESFLTQPSPMQFQKHRNDCSDGDVSGAANLLVGMCRYAKKWLPYL